MFLEITRTILLQLDRSKIPATLLALLEPGKKANGVDFRWNFTVRQTSQHRRPWESVLSATVCKSWIRTDRQSILNKRKGSKHESHEETNGSSSSSIDFQFEWFRQRSRRWRIARHQLSERNENFEKEKQENAQREIRWRTFTKKYSQTRGKTFSRTKQRRLFPNDRFHHRFWFHSKNDGNNRSSPARGTLFTSKYANRTGHGLPIFTTERALERRNQVNFSQRIFLNSSLRKFNVLLETKWISFTRRFRRTNNSRSFHDDVDWRLISAFRSSFHCRTIRTRSNSNEVKLFSKPNEQPSFLLIPRSITVPDEQRLSRPKFNDETSFFFCCLAANGRSWHRLWDQQQQQTRSYRSNIERFRSTTRTNSFPSFTRIIATCSKLRTEKNFVKLFSARSHQSSFSGKQCTASSSTFFRQWFRLKLRRSEKWHTIVAVLQEDRKFQLSSKSTDCYSNPARQTICLVESDANSRTTIQQYRWIVVERAANHSSHRKRSSSRSKSRPTESYSQETFVLILTEVGSFVPIKKQSFNDSSTSSVVWIPFLSISDTGARFSFHRTFSFSTICYETK